MASEMMSSELAVISGKRPLLSSPGGVLSDDFYTPASCEVALAETTANTGRYSVSLSSPTFGGTSSIFVPNQSFLGDCYLTLELPALAAGQSIAYGWGYQVIQSISYLFGGSNVSQLTLSGHSVFQMMLAQSETADKMSECAFLAGGLVGTPPGPPTTGQFTNEIVPLNTATIKLPLPWSTYAGGDNTKKWFDTSLLASPIQILITFNNASSIYGGTFTGSYPPAAFRRAIFFTRQADLTYKDQGLRAKMYNNPGLSACYPFQWVQSFSSPIFQGRRGSPVATVTADTFNTPVSVVLQGFLDSDLVGMVIGVVRLSRQSLVAGPDLPTVPCAMAYEELNDITLTLNGQVVVSLPAYSYQNADMNSMLGGSFASWKIQRSAGVIEPIAGGPVDVKVYPLMIDFSRLRSEAFTGKFFNVMRYPGQPMNLSFFTQTNEEYQLHASFCYNAVNVVNNGVSNIHIS